MEFLRLRKRVAIAVRAHTLLKDKLEGLMKKFLALVKQYKEARLALDRELPEILTLFLLATVTSDRQVILTALDQAKGQLDLRLTQKKIMSVFVPRFEVSIIPGASYSLLDTPVELDDAIAGLKEYFPKILKLAELEQAVRLLAREIEKTRRRVNALEYIMIPQLKETMRSIKNKLDELERSNISRLMKIKELLAR